VDVVVLFEGLEFADFGAVRFGEFGEILGDSTQLR
jgi:hypothetical protein